MSFFQNNIIFFKNIYIVSVYYPYKFSKFEGTNFNRCSGFNGKQRIYWSLCKASRTYQLIIDDSQLTTLVGKYLTSISFRLPSNATSSWHATDATFSNYEVFLSNGVEPVDRQFNFSANVVGTQTQVRSGSLVVPAGALTSGSDPNAFSYDIVFNTPYLYNSGQNLVIEIRHTGNDVGSRSTNSTGTSTAGYGTLYTACWQGTSGVVQGNFSFVKINAVDNLGVSSVEIDDEFSVYPNPVAEVMWVKTNKEIFEFNIFNNAGQKIKIQKNSEKTSGINVSDLPKGSYVLQIVYQNGDATSTRFIKK